MRTLFKKSILIILGFALLTAACAENNGRFESKTFVKKGVNPNGKPTTKAAKETKPVAVATVGKIENNVNSKINNINPSKINETQIVIEFKSLRTLKDSQKLNEMELTADVVLFDPIKKVGLSVQSVALDTAQAADGFLTLNQTLEISRAQLNDHIKNLIQKQGSSADTEFSFELSINYKSKDDEASDKCKNASASTIVLSSINLKEIDVNSIVGKCTNETDKQNELSFIATVKSKDAFTAEEILRSDKGVSCEVKNQADNTTHFFVITKSVVHHTDQVEDINDIGALIDLALKPDSDDLQVQTVKTTKLIQQKMVNEYTEFLSTNGLTDTGSFSGQKEFIDLQEQSCTVNDDKTLGMNKFDRSVTIELNDIQKTVYKGCCLQSDKFLKEIINPSENYTPPSATDAY